MNKTRFILPLVGILYFLIWFGIFSATSVNDKNTGVEKDTLSKQSFNKTAVNSDRGPNPNAPYFVGFNLLTKYGIPAEELRYIRDTITNDTLYRSKLTYAKVSYVDGSLSTPKNHGLKTSYSFEYGTNNGDIQTLEVISDLGDGTINIVIKDTAKTKVFDKTFVIVYS